MPCKPIYIECYYAKFLGILLLFSLLAGCKSAIETDNTELNSSSTLNFIESKVINSGFRQLMGLKKTYTIGGEDFVCFMDAITQKKLHLKAIDSDKEYFVPLNAVLNKGEQISSVDIVGLDTILLITQYTNQLYFLNRNGEITKQMHLNISPTDFKEYSFTISHGKTPFIYNDTSLIVCLSAKKSIDFISFEQYYTATYSDSVPFIFKVDNVFSDSLTTSYGLFGFHLNLGSKGDWSTTIKSVSFTSDKLLIKHLLSDSLFIINPHTLKVQRKVKISSSLIGRPIKSEVISLKQMDQGFDHNKHNNSFARVSSQITYHESLNKYFLSIASMRKPYFSVLQEYDSTFNLLTETIIDSTKGYHFECLTTNNRFIATDYSTYSDSANFYTTNSFTLFEYVKD